MSTSGIDWDALEAQVKKTHKVRWFVYTGGSRNELIPWESTMRGSWPAGFEVKCSCGWETHSGGYVRSACRTAIQDHRSDEVVKLLTDDQRKALIEAHSKELGWS
jgi:hypothetical protein